MPNNDLFNNFKDYLPFGWMIGLSFWGGIAGYLRKVKQGSVFSFTELVGELFISGFVGVLTFLLCQSAQLNTLLTAAMVGISGHMGSRAIFMIEKIVESRLHRITNTATELSVNTENKEGKDDHTN